MNKLSVSVFVPIYKDIQALKLILDALQHQTYKNFDVIITEDDNSEEVKSFLQSYKVSFTIKHVSHADKGNRKAIIMNKALVEVSSEYIIFIDGDTIPFSTFVESHLQLAEYKTILCGRRVNIGDRVSQDLREGLITAYDIEKNYLMKYFFLRKDNIRHYEQGIRFHPKSLIFKILSKYDNNAHIVGSNFSCFKEDMFSINGFDEDIVGGSKDDVDLEWRFVMSGCKLKSAKFCANLFHLNHKRKSRVEDEKIIIKQMGSISA